MRKRRQPNGAPDGKDWRDPKMTVTMRYRVYGVLVYREMLPGDRQMQSDENMRRTGAPHWSYDPSYNWRRK